MLSKTISIASIIALANCTKLSALPHITQDVPEDMEQLAQVGVNGAFDNDCENEWHEADWTVQDGYNSCYASDVYWNKDWWREQCDGEFDEEGWVMFSYHTWEEHFVSKTLYEQKCEVY